jgi:hypothetical protein
MAALPVSEQQIKDAPVLTPAPEPAVIFCPYCGTRHVDEGEWETKPHHKHLCSNRQCGKLFRYEGADGEYFYGVNGVPRCGFCNDRGVTQKVVEGTGTLIVEPCECTRR